MPHLLLNTQNEFLAYLTELEAAVLAEQRGLAEETYGPLPTQVPELFEGDAKSEGDEASAT